MTQLVEIGWAVWRSRTTSKHTENAAVEVRALYQLSMYYIIYYYYKENIDDSAFYS